MFEDIEQLFDEVSSKNNTNNIGKNILVNPSTIPSSSFKRLKLMPFFLNEI